VNCFQGNAVISYVKKCCGVADGDCKLIMKNIFFVHMIGKLWFCFTLLNILVVVCYAKPCSGVADGDLNLMHTLLYTSCNIYCVVNKCIVAPCIHIVIMVTTSTEV
jgi:hypothetical protein